MATVRFYINAIFSCSAFDREARLCTQYETRPDLCRVFSPERCGFSKVSRPTLKPDGTLYSHQELIGIKRTILENARPTAEEAIGNLLKRVSVTAQSGSPSESSDDSNPDF